MKRFFLCFISFFAAVISPTKSTTISLTGGSTTHAAYGTETNKAIALVYRGPGACEEGCADAAYLMAEKAGFKVHFVDPEDMDGRMQSMKTSWLFNRAHVWIQPGGVSNEAYYSMTPQLRKRLYEFIEAGGGYVGFCAGAFMATSRIGGTRDPGLSVFPGGTGLYRTYVETSSVSYSLQPVTWKMQDGTEKKRTVFFEGGPYLYGVENQPGVEIMARYQYGAVASARTTFGKGRVYITGLHPEAPAIWTEEDGIKDPDGVDHELAMEMITWAAFGI